MRRSKGDQPEQEKKGLHLHSSSHQKHQKKEREKKAEQVHHRYAFVQCKHREKEEKKKQERDIRSLALSFHGMDHK